MAWLRPIGLIGLIGSAAALVCLAAPAWADEPADPEASGGTRISYDHRGQFGVHVQIGDGYRVLFPYEKDDGSKVYCGETKDSGEYKAVCTGRAPFFTELGVSYGVTSAIEVLVDFRFSLEQDFKSPGSDSRPRPFSFAPGVKLYIDDDGSTKFFSTVQASLDFTDFEATGATTGTDVGIRNVNGVLIDLHRTFGVYLHFGETIGFARWLRFEMDGGLGIQGRYP